MRNNLLLIGAMFFALSVHCQNFVGATKSNDGQTINLAKDQVLEVKLPCNPSTGYGWYLTSSSQQSAVSYQQIGDWKFVTDKNRGMLGQAGTEVIRFIGVSQGTSELRLEYKRPWEKNKSAVDVFKLSINSKGKYTGSELKVHKVYKVENQQTSSSSTLKSLKSSIPSSFSWQAQCSPVKNQESCGSCWAFASTGQFEAIINITDGNIRSLSEQWLINCDTNAYGCDGGWCPNNMWVSPGAVYDSELPYSGVDGTCGTSYTYHEKADSSAYIDTFDTVSIKIPTNDQIKQAIYNYGPVWVSVDAGTSTFESYTGGIYTANDGTDSLLDHAVVLVGWKDTIVSDSISGYWILRNSWGNLWGEHGYMRIGYRVNAVGAFADYIVYKGGIPSCSGTPNPGNTVSSANQECSYEDFTLTLENSTTGRGVSYQWQSSSDNSTWKNISDATNSIYVASQTDTIYYRCEVSCLVDSISSNAIKEISLPPPTTPTAGTQNASVNQITWNWNPVAGASGYKWNTIDDYMSAIGNGTCTSYTQTDLSPNTQYKLYVWSENICGNSTELALKENTTMGVNQLTINNEQITIYPNPVNSLLVVSCSLLEKNSLNISIYDIMGNKVGTIVNEVKRKGNYTFEYNAEWLRSGVYIVKVTNDMGVAVKKIVKE